MKYINPRHLPSTTSVPTWLLGRKGLSCSAKACYAALVQYSDEDGACNLTHRQLAEAMCISERQVKRRLKELEEKKYIEVIRPTGMGRLNHENNIYKFLSVPD